MKSIINFKSLHIVKTLLLTALLAGNMFGFPTAILLEIPFVTLEFGLFISGYMMYLINGL